MAAGLDDIFQSVLSKLGELPGIVGKVGDILGRFHSSVTPLVSAVTGLVMAQTAAATADNKLVTALDKQTAATNRLATLFERMFAAATSRMQGASTALAIPGHSPLALPGPAGGGEAGGGPAGASSALAGIAKIGLVAAAALGVLAVAVNVAESEFRKLEGFVRLFNPGVITIFHQALDNLGATIGRAFVPIFQDATEVVRRYAGVLAQVVDAAAPMVKLFADIFANLLVGVLTQLGNLIRSSLPAIGQMMEVFVLLAQVSLSLFNVFAETFRAVMLFSRIMFEITGLGLVVRVLTKVFEALNQVMTIFDEAISLVEVVLGAVIDGIMAFIESFFPVKEIMNQLAVAVQYVIRNMFVFSVMLAKLAGLNGVVDALIGYVEGKLKTGDVAAQSPQIKSLEQLSKDLALAAAAAGGAAGGAGVKNQAEFWAKTLEEMRLAKQNGVSITEILLRIEAAILKKFGIGGGAEAPNPGGGNVGPGGLPDNGPIGNGIVGGALGAFGGGAWR